MLRIPRAVIGALLIGAGAVFAALIVIGMATEGFAFGILGAIAVFSFAGSAFIADRSATLRRLRDPTSGELWLLTSLVGLFGLTAALAWILEPGAWIVVPLAGLILVHTVYGLSNPDQPSPRGLGISDASPIVAASISTLRDVDVFRKLPHQEISKIGALGALVDLKPGVLLGTAGKFGWRLYVILQGTVELSADSAAGPAIVRVVGAGESVPLASILDDGLLITTATTMTEVRAWVVERRRLLAYLHANPRTALSVYRAAAGVLGGRYRATISELAASVVAAKETDWTAV